MAVIGWWDRLEPTKEFVLDNGLNVKIFSVNAQYATVIEDVLVWTMAGIICLEDAAIHAANFYSGMTGAAEFLEKVEIRVEQAAKDFSEAQADLNKFNALFFRVKALSDGW